MGEQPQSHRLPNAFSRFGLLSAAGRLYWELDRAYWTARAVAAGGEMNVTVAETTARFELSTRWECRRAAKLGGERAVMEALLSELSGTETVWDVGACVGTYTCFVARALTTGRVVGFEPEATNRSRLRVNLERNAAPERFEIAPVALAAENGTCPLASEFIEAGAGHHYLAPDARGPTVETRRGDSVAEEYPSPDLLKIDVQGAELAVLEGLGGILEDVSSVYLELHSEKCRRYGATAQQIESFLRTAGFSLTPLGDPTNRRSGVSFIHATKSDSNRDILSV